MLFRKHFVISVYAVVMFFLHSQAYADNTHKKINLQQLAARAVKQNKVVILYMSATHCAYCMKLNRDVIEPMLGNKGYQESVLLQKIQIDLILAIVDFNGKVISSDDLIEKYNIIATPTLLFVNSQGEEIADRLEGYQSEEFYWYYLDKSIDKAAK